MGELNGKVAVVTGFGRGIGRAISLALVSRDSEAERLIKEAIRNFRKVDMLVNNAGIARPAMCYKITEEKWNTIINVNLTGTMNCIR